MASYVRTLIQSFLRIFFGLLYTNLAFLYDAVAWLSSMGQWNSWRRTAITNLDHGIILELGHGTGQLMADIQTAGFQVVGIDPSRQMNRMTQKRLSSRGLSAKIVREQAQALPFPRQSISNVISTFPSDYIVDPATLSEAHRVLTKRGKLTMVGIIKITGATLPDRFADWLYRITGQSGSTPIGWDNFLQEHGFDARLEEIDLGRSLVTRIVATRMEHANTRNAGNG